MTPLNLLRVCAYNSLTATGIIILLYLPEITRAARTWLNDIKEAATG